MKHSIEFEHKIRAEWLSIEAYALSDYEGVYSVGVSGVYLDGVNVMGLLTEEDILEIESAIEPALTAEAGEARATGSNTIPGPFPTL